MALLALFFVFNTQAHAITNSQGNYTVQVSSHETSTEAQSSIDQLKGKGLAAYQTTFDVPGKGTRYRVNIGNFHNAGEAAEFRKKLLTKNLIAKDSIVQKNSEQSHSDSPAIVVADLSAAPIIERLPLPSPSPSPVISASPLPLMSPTPVPAPTPNANSIKNTDGLTTLVKGFAAVEFEESKNFGYNVASGIPNFTASADGADRSNMNLLANLELDVKKGKTTLVSILQVGEVYYGDATTDGGQGSKQKVLALRDLYIDHNFSDEFNGKAGIQYIYSDPRGFVLRDHYASATIDYKTNLFEGSLWYAQAARNPPGITTASPNYVSSDNYFGISTNFNIFSDFKSTIFGIYRKTTEVMTSNTDLVTPLTGDSAYYWVGLTLEYLSLPFSADVTFIQNGSNFTAQGGGGVSDNNNAYLADLRLRYLWTEPELLFSLEGLATSGASNVNASNHAVLNQRKNFASPDPGAAFMFNVATSNGLDDAPGAQKQSVIASLSLPEGLNIGAFKLTKNFGSDLMIYGIYGMLNSATNNSATQSNILGTEIDFGASYKLAPETTWLLDYGQFTPGAYFASKDAALLISSRIKYDF